jgi:hypothetical protein
MSYVTCITTIDTIIPHIPTIYTNDAYTYDTSLFTNSFADGTVRMWDYTGMP